MSNLSDAQLVLLSNAAQRTDRIIALPPKAEATANAKLIRPLLKRELVEEVPTLKGYPVYRRDRDGDTLSVRITDVGVAAIGVDPVANPADAGSPSEGSSQPQTAAKKASRNPPPKKKRTGKAKPASSRARLTLRGGDASPASKSKKEQIKNARPGAKRDLLIAMLQNKQGADIDAIMRATDWLPHTVRAAISGLRKAGFAVELEKIDDAKSVYSIVGEPKRARKPA